MQTAEQTAVRVFRSSSVPLDKFSESELWQCIVHNWNRRFSLPKDIYPRYALMTGCKGTFDYERAANVIAAILTSKGVALQESGELDNVDLACFLSDQ